jgi:hypothetical protein
MVLICKQETDKIDGVKLMEFTKGNEYKFTETEQGVYETKDDKGKSEKFWDVYILFEAKN